jgi:SOS-response transcriptional repressor LexA
LLSGETTDPRISTLSIIAEYFAISVDELTAQDLTRMANLDQPKPRFVPIVNWEQAASMQSVQDLDLAHWSSWQSIPGKSPEALSRHVFALESRPSLYSRFPKGAIFIIDPDVKPLDGDTVLVKICAEDELTLREMYVDPPERKLQSLIPGVSALVFNPKEHVIVGVNMSTILFNRA